jgi:hypothetical protein
MVGRVAPAEREPCTALVETSPAQGYDQMLQRTGYAWPQMKQWGNPLSLMETSATKKAVALACLLLSILLTTGAVKLRHLRAEI